MFHHSDTYNHIEVFLRIRKSFGYGDAAVSVGFALRKLYSLDRNINRELLIRVQLGKQKTLAAANLQETPPLEWVKQRGKVRDKLLCVSSQALPHACAATIDPVIIRRDLPGALELCPPGQKDRNALNDAVLRMALTAVQLIEPDLTIRTAVHAAVLPSVRLRMAKSRSAVSVHRHWLRLSGSICHGASGAVFPKTERESRKSQVGRMANRNPYAVNAFSSSEKSL
jgi:hypothetical protein